MTQCDSTSSGRASTGDWQTSRLVGEGQGGGRPGGSIKLRGSEGGGTEGCGEHSLTGGGRGQLQELGSGVVSWAGSVLHKPALAHTQ